MKLYYRPINSLFHPTSEFAVLYENLKLARHEIECEAVTFRDELRFIAKFVGVVLPEFDSSTYMEESSVFMRTVAEIHQIQEVISAEHASGATVGDSSIVTINAGG